MKDTYNKETHEPADKPKSFTNLLLANHEEKILMLRMTTNVILVTFSVHCSEKIWIIVNFY